MSESDKELYKACLIANLQNHPKFRNVLSLTAMNLIATYSMTIISFNCLLIFLISSLNIGNSMLLVLELAKIIIDTKRQVDKTPRIEDQNDYYKCLELYREYIKRLADIISKVEVKDSLQLAKFIDLCFISGFFSSNGCSLYQTYKKDYDGRYHDLLGTRVVTGLSACRHNTFFGTDLLNELGCEAYYLSVQSIYEQERKKYDMILPSSNHAVTAIIENNKRFIYDFTWHTDAYFDDSVSLLQGVNSDINIYVGPNLLDYYVDTERYQGNWRGYILSRSRYNVDLSRFLNTPNMNISLSKWIENIELTDRLYKSWYSRLRYFRVNNEELTEELSNLSKKLIPASRPNTRLRYVKK